MILDKTIKLSDLLTSLTIIISVIALSITWSKDRITRETEMADRVRSASALALTKLDRWELQNLSLYQELQPSFVETSEMLSEEYNIIKARDHLWKRINEERTLIARRILDEKIMTSYFNLLSHFPDTRDQFQILFEELRIIEEEIIKDFLGESESNILYFEEHQKKYTSSMLGNALRATALKYKKKFKNQADVAIEPVRKFLFDVISKSNKDILKVRRE